MNYAEESLKLHYQWKGKLDTVPKMKVENSDDLSLAYTPGVAPKFMNNSKTSAKVPQILAHVWYNKNKKWGILLNSQRKVLDHDKN